MTTPGGESAGEFARAKELGNKACDFYCDWYANGKASDAGFAAYELVSWVREMLVEIDKSEAAVAAHVQKAVEPYLQTIEAIEKEVANVYCHITNGRISKANTKAESVIGESDDITAKLVEEAVKEAMTCRVCGNKDSVCSSNWTREVRRAVEEFRERAAVEIKTKADARKCEVYGHDDRYCAYCSAYDDAVDISQQIIRAMPLSPAENQADGVTEGKS